MAANHAEVNDASVYNHAQNMQITNSNLIDALLTLNDVLSQTWSVNSSASFHVTPKDCFTTLMQATVDTYILEITMLVLLKVLAQCISILEARNPVITRSSTYNMIKHTKLSWEKA